ncbi:hypothetical protein D0Z07_0934 [Hyphodiscus hymeniophilus]|uniref:Uncharacterized protein n=1 Tax=Hyphodiscus hymeniophilus TaxID=353542 RepID=A0A9P6VRI8_9HELO|nr:hypothetical protein D0Z07_0934 [Hyphodiscus hymeniophilus]
MCIVFTCGEQECTKPVSGYEGLQCQCHHCVCPALPTLLLLCTLLFPASPSSSSSSQSNLSQGNWSATVIKRQPWFTFCFVPVVPLSIHGYEDIIRRTATESPRCCGASEKDAGGRWWDADASARSATGLEWRGKGP